MIARILSNSLGCVGCIIAFSAPNVAVAQNFDLPYVSLGAGVNFMPGASFVSSSSLHTTPTTTDPRAGFIFSGSAGVNLGQGWRFEGEGGLRRSNVSVTTQGGSGAAHFNVEESTFTAMANLWRDFDLGDGFGIHAGGGVGMAMQHAIFSGGGVNTSDSNTHFGYQLGFGPDFVLGGMRLALDYRLLGASHDGLSNATLPFGAAGTFRSGNLIHAVLFQLRVPLN